MSGGIRFGLAGKDAAKVSKGAFDVWTWTDRDRVQLLIVDLSSVIFCGQIVVSTLSSSCEIICIVFLVS